MATTYMNLWPLVVCWENLLGAYRRCRRGKRYRPEAARFDFAWDAADCAAIDCDRESLAANA